MKSFRVLSALFDPTSGYLEVVKELTADDDSTSLQLHRIHPETLEWRAAEYDIDDIDELVDMVLHDSFIDDVRPLQIPIEEAKQLARSRTLAAKTRLASPKVKDKVEHKARLLEAGVDPKYITAADDEPIDVIKMHSPFDAEVIGVKREHVAKARSDIVAERESASQRPSGSERAAALREALKSSTERQASARPTPPTPPTRAQESGSLNSITLTGRRPRQ